MKRTKDSEVMKHLHPAVGVPVKVSVESITDLEEPGKWLVNPGEKEAFLNPGYKLDPNSRNLYAWIALVQASRSTKKNEKHFASLLRAVFAHKITVEEFEAAVFATQFEQPVKKAKKIQEAPPAIVSNEEH